MGKAIFITGTGTEIGKTVATSFLAFVFQKMGLNTKIFKPIQTGLAEDGVSFADQYWYEKVVGLAQSEGLYYMEPAVSPHLAATLTNTTIDPALIVEKIEQWKRQYDIVLVEGAGGLAVPLIEKEQGFYMTNDLIREYNIPIIIVSLAGLGAIHHTVTTVSYAQQQGIRILGLIFNQFNAESIIHVNNIETIKKMLDLPVIATLPSLAKVTKHTMMALAECWLENNKQKQLLQEVLSVAI
ncbi:dethiobiotin synthase [Parageobacillus toebii]|uniref:ATP-dependent dethiobiotin synthetase BioD n=1 Tax=Parageobacillus toebii TaxID=153151 RepID=A0A150MYH1_9BACL|nr:dethiobiotin synthase [Parageobacillus toebii]KYD29453.1 Dethiobiotin synthetase [Parageobacillus toebii]